MKCKVSEARISTNGLMIKHKGEGEGMHHGSRHRSPISLPPRWRALRLSLSILLFDHSVFGSSPSSYTGRPLTPRSFLGCRGRNGRKNWGRGGICSTPMPANLEPNIKDTKNKFIFKKARALRILQDFSLPKWKHKAVFWRSVTSWPADSIKSLWQAREREQIV